MKVFILLSIIAATFSPGDPPRKAAKIEIITTQSDTANYLRKATSSSSRTFSDLSLASSCFSSSYSSFTP